MSYKNKLQEYYQKKSLPLPQYDSKQIDIVDNVPIWNCTIILKDGKEFQGEYKGKKKYAEQMVAKQVLDILKETNIEKKK